MLLVLVFLLALMGMCLVMLVRSFVVYDVRIRRLDELYDYVIAHHPDFDVYRKDEKQHGTYNYLMVCLHKWTYKQFYSKTPEETFATKEPK